MDRAPPWRKLGLVLQATGEGLERTHAMLPTPHVMDDRIRIFYASCDLEMRGRVFFADFDREPPFRIIRRSQGPVLDVGPPGAFDCDGANPSQALIIDGRLALLYIGWRRGPPEAPYTLFGAAAFSDDDGLSFERAEEPWLAPLRGERQFRTGPFLEQGPDGPRLLYIGGDGFRPCGERQLPRYALMELTCSSALEWDGPPRLLLAPDLEADEIGFGRPVSYDDAHGTRRLMLSIRTAQGYRLVESDRRPEAIAARAFRPVIPEPLEPWESHMTCFGARCTVEDHELLFYNGDGYGRTGTGLAWRPTIKA